MSAKKRWFKTRTGWGRTYGRSWDAWSGKDNSDTNRVRVTDARELTVDQAIAKTIVKTVYLEGYEGPLNNYVPDGYTARIKGGKVTVRKIKGAKQ